MYQQQNTALATKSIPQAASIVVIAIGCVVLVGWSLDLTVLKSLRPGLATMKANTALGFILAGISLWLGTTGGKKLFSILSQVCAIAIFIIGIITLTQYIFNWNLGIDELLFRDSPISPLTMHPGRMGLNTALNFSLLGGALWLLGSKKRQQKIAILVSQCMSLVAAFLALQALVGHAFEVRVLYRFSVNATSMAIHTAVTFVVLTLGILCVNGDRGLMKPITSKFNGGLMARRLIPSAIFIPLILGWLILGGQRADYYDPAFGMSLMVISIEVIFVGLIWNNAIDLNKIDGDRKRISDILRQNKQILQRQLAEIESIYQTAPIGLTVLDTDLRYLRINQRLAEINGVSAEEHIGRTVREIVPDLADEVEPLFRQVLETGEPILNLEINGETAAQPGIHRTWLENFFPLGDADGQIIGINIVVQEISDRKRAEIALKNSERRIASLANLSPVGIFRCDRAGECVYVNDRAGELTGLSREESLGTGWARAIHPDDRERVLQEWLRFVENNGPFRLEYRFLHADGTIRWVIGQASVETDEDGQLMSYISTVTDISERKQAEAALRESEQRYRTLFETMDEGFCICEMLIDENGEPTDYRFLEINPAFEAMTELRQATGKTALELVPNLEDFWIETYGRVALSGEPIRFENQSIAMNKWFDVNAFRIGEAQSRQFAILFSNISDLKQAEARFQRLAANIPGAIYQYILHPDGRDEFTYISPKCREIYGYSPEELLQDFGLVWAMVHSDDIERIRRANTISAQHLEPFDVEFRLLAPSGRLKWIHAKSIPELQSNGDIIYDGLVMDISDRKIAQLNEQFLKDLDWRLRQLSDAETMVWETVSSLGEYLKADRCFWHENDWENRLAIVKRNWRREEVSDLAGTYPLEVYFTSEQLARFAAGQTIVVADVTTHPDTAPFAQNYLPLGIGAFIDVPCIQEGRWTATFTINTKTARNWRDHEVALLQETVARLWSIIEQTRAVQALRESEERFQIFMNNSPLAAFIKDEAGYLIYTSRCVEELFNKSPGELVGCKDSDFLPDAIAREIQEHDRRVFATGAATEFIETIPNAAGNLSYWLTNKFLLRDRNQKPLLGGVAVDISDRLQIEQQLRQQAAELSQLNQALTKTTEQLTERNEELNRFVYVVSHDLKAPLRAISNLSEWIEEDLSDRLDEENQRQMTLLRSRVARLETMIDGLLQYSRVGRTEVATQTVDVSALLAEIIDSLAPPATFTISIQSQMPTLVTKRLLLSQVFANLISNAVKHHHRSDGRIEISATQKGDYYEFALSDDGPGIAKENCEKVFGIFETLKARDVQESTGIGLSIVKKIVETEGGKICVESELGCGATFRFTWPLLQ